MHIGWAAQWLQYETELRMNLSLPALVVPIFKEQVRDEESKLLSSTFAMTLCGAAHLVDGKCLDDAARAQGLAETSHKAIAGVTQYCLSADHARRAGGGRTCEAADTSRAAGVRQA